jgi:hypothetical protein
MPIKAHRTPELDRLYKKAWGNPWPSRSDTIYRTEVLPAPSNEDVMDLDPEDDGTASIDVYGGGFPIEIADKWEYICLDGVLEITEALDWSSRVQDIMVVRSEYQALLGAMEKIQVAPQTQGIVVTGQPGIGVYSNRFDSVWNTNLHLRFFRQDYVPYLSAAASSAPSTSNGGPTHKEEIGHL